MISETFTKTRQMHESMSLAGPSATHFVRDTEMCPLDGCSAVMIHFFPDGSNAKQGSSVTMIMISSRAIKWVKVIATKRKRLVIRISLQFILNDRQNLTSYLFLWLAQFLPPFFSVWSWPYLIANLNQNSTEISFNFLPFTYQNILISRTHESSSPKRKPSNS